MAIGLGKLTIIVGAGLFGAVLAKEGRMPGIRDFYSGANKVYNLIITDEKSTSKPKPLNDSLMAQVNSLRQELQLLASNRPLTIVTTNGSGTTGKFGIIIIVAVVGYGYVWWKGWKLPDMMFATKRSLSEATNAVSKQLDNAFSSIAATKRYVSSRIDRVSATLDEVAELTASTQEEVSGLREKSRGMSLDVKSVHDVVYSLESRLNRFELMQDDTYAGVTRLLNGISVDNQMSVDHIQENPSSSRPALELPQRAMSLPPLQLEELQTSPPVSPRARQPLETAVSSASGLRILHEDTDVAEAKSTPRASVGLNVTEDGSSSARVFGRTLSGLSSVFTRARPGNKQ